MSKEAACKIYSHHFSFSLDQSKCKMSHSCKGNAIDHVNQLTQACKDSYRTSPEELHKNSVNFWVKQQTLY